MSGFLLAALALFLLALGILAWRRDGPRDADRDDPNLHWYRQRARELGEGAGHGNNEGAEPGNEPGNETLRAEARLRLLEDTLPDARPATAADSSAAGLGRVALLALGAVLLLLSAAIYRHTGALEDVLIHRDLARLKPGDGAPARARLMERIAARSAAREDNLQYLDLLGQLHMADENYRAASAHFARLAARAPQDPRAQAMAAQAQFLAAGRVLDDRARLLAERALAVDPRQRTALGLLGMAAFEAGSYRAAASYWERLQAQETPASPAYKMLGDVLALARQRGGLAAPADQAAPLDKTAVGAHSAGISVSLAFAEGVAAEPGATVFVFARPASARGGMPIAVRRLSAGDLPLTLRLSDADSMAGQLLSAAGAVRVSAQLSVNGQPGLANARLSGAAGPVAVGGAEASVTIVLDALDGQS